MNGSDEVSSTRERSVDMGGYARTLLFIDLTLIAFIYHTLVAPKPFYKHVLLSQTNQLSVPALINEELSFRIKRSSIDE